MTRQAGVTAGRVGRPWREVCGRVYLEEDYCWICLAWVDQRLPSTHRMSRSADHLVQLRHDGKPHDRANLRLAHLGCNSRRAGLLQHVSIEACACQLGLPCAALQPEHKRGYVALDPSQV